MQTLIEIWRILQVVLGVGLVIFVHESGHFFAARWCGVGVEVFSLGFGPRLFGWMRQGTLYQVCLIPLGGYVKMAGEETRYQGLPPAPGDLASKSVGQRFFIYSGGVLMNVLFGIVVFPIILMWGVPFSQPLLGPSVPGSPAWHARLAPGTRVHSVNGHATYAFMHIPNEVALGSPDATELEITDPGTNDLRRVTVHPEYDQSLGIYTIGVRQAYDPERRVLVDKDSPASRAGVQSDDRLLEVLGESSALPVEVAASWTETDGKPLVGRFERDGKTFTATITPEQKQPEGGRALLGVMRPTNLVVDMRPSKVVDALHLAVGDRIVSSQGQPVHDRRTLLEPILAAAAAKPPEPVQLVVVRDGEDVTLSGPALSAAEAVAFSNDLALGPDDKTTQLVVMPGSAAAVAGLKNGDRVLRIDGAEITSFEKLSETVRAKGASGRPLALSVERPMPDGAEFLDIHVEPSVPEVPYYGFDMRSAQYVYKADGPVSAVLVGIGNSWRFIQEAYLTLKGILFGRVSSENVGGIITIGRVSHSWAAVGLTKLFFFLCMLSMNLAFLNILPIPVLDGGHLFFLIIEKIKGSPVSERVLSYSQMVGLVLILSLMIYVTYNDIQRLLPR